MGLHTASFLGSLLNRHVEAIAVRKEFISKFNIPDLTLSSSHIPTALISKGSWSSLHDQISDFVSWLNIWRGVTDRR